MLKSRDREFNSVVRHTWDRNCHATVLASVTVKITSAKYGFIFVRLSGSGTAWQHTVASLQNTRQFPADGWLAFVWLKLLLHRQTTYTTSYWTSSPDLGILQGKFGDFELWTSNAFRSEDVSLRFSSIRELFIYLFIYLAT